MERRKRFQTHKSKKKLFLLLGAGVVVIAGVVTALELTNTTYFFHKRPPAITASQDTKGEVKTSATASSDSGSKSTSSSNKSSDNPTGTAQKDGDNSTAVLLAPTGDFVSNHHPNLSGSPAPSQIASVCTTTPGATCVISFSKDGVTKSLASETADSGGSAYWDWKLQDIGLTTGSWQITATATLNGQTKSATDALKLEVSE
ncbi:MAG TPA: hypothetical protein VJ843_06050 [Candidatus Saccharimonadales bacterium]|nr:hypothetical protein [Candidatus Saccharimonadales bacterium]